MLPSSRKASKGKRTSNTGTLRQDHAWKKNKPNKKQGQGGWNRMSEEQITWSLQVIVRTLNESDLKATRDGDTKYGTALKGLSRQ